MADIEKRQIIVDVDVIADKSVKTVTDLVGQLQHLQTEQKKVGETTGKNSVEYQKYETAIRATKKSIQEERKAMLDSIKAGNAKKDSLEQLRKELSGLKTSYAQLSKAEREGAEGTKLLSNIQTTTSSITEAEEAMGVYSRNVGNYADSQKGLNSQFGDAPGLLGRMVGGINGVGSAFKALLMNPIVLVFSLIVGALAALYKAFKQTKVGAELFATAGAAVSGAFSVIIGLADKLATTVKDAFENPKEAIIGLGNAIKDNIINRFIGMLDLAKGVGKVFGLLFDGEFKKAGEAAGDLGTAITQIFTGWDEEQQKNISSGLKDLTQEVIDQTAAFAKLERQRIATRKSNRELAKSIEELKTQQQEYAIIAEDDTRSWEEREDAAKKMLDVTEKLAQKELAMSRANLSIINQEIALRQKKGADVEDLKDQQLSAFQAVSDADRNYRTTIADRAEKDAKRERDLIEKNLDVIQKDLEVRRGIMLKNSTNEDLSFKQRAQNLSDLRKLQDDSFNAQITEIQKLSDTHIDANDLLGASDSQTLLNKIRELGLSEIAEQRMIEIVTDRKTAVNDLGGAYNDLANSQTDGVKALLELTTDEQIAEVTKKYNDAVNNLGEVARPIQLTTESDDNYEKRLDAHFDFVMAKHNLDREAAETMADLEERLLKQRNEAIAKINDDANTDAEQKFADHYDKMASVISEWGDRAMQVFSSLAQLQDALNERELERLEENYERETEALDDKLEKGIISQEAYDSKMEKLDTDLAKEQAKIAREQAIRDKAMAIFEIGLSTAIGIMGAIAKFPATVGMPWAAIIGAMGAVQTAAVLASPLPKASKGMYIQGASHANGGVPIEAEGGEVIMNKRAVSMFGSQLSAMNVAGGGVPFPVQQFPILPSHNIPDGGYALRQINEAANMNAISAKLDALSNAILNRPLYLTVEDYRRADKQYAEIVDRGRM